MTRPNPDLTASIVVSGEPRSTAYRIAEGNPQALAVNRLKKESSSSNSKNRKKMANTSERFKQTSALLERYHGDGQSLAACSRDLLIYDAQATIDRLAAMVTAESHIALGFDFACKSEAKYPKAPKGAQWLLAVEIAAQIERLIRIDEVSVAAVVMDYVNHVHLNSRMMLLPEDKRGSQLRAYLKFVKHLRTKELTTSFLGFSFQGQKDDLGEALKRLDLAENTKINYVHAPNGKMGAAALKHLAILVVSGSKPASSAGFRYAMTIAAISHEWHLSGKEPAKVPGPEVPSKQAGTSDQTLQANPAKKLPKLTQQSLFSE